MCRFRWLGIAAALLLAVANAEAGVTLNPGSGNTSLTVFADDGVFPFSSVTLDQFESIPFPFPFSSSHSASDEAASASSTYQLSDAGFRITFEHARGGDDAGGEAQSYGYIYFSVDNDAVYELSGAYTAIDPEGRQVVLDVYLRDVTLDLEVFSSAQTSFGETPNESFTLGGEGGDASNYLAGPLSGPLIAGREYRLFYGALIADRPLPAVQTASAAGFVHFAIVPEPTTAGLLLAGLIAIVSHARVARR